MLATMLMVVLQVSTPSQAAPAPVLPPEEGVMDPQPAPAYPTVPEDAAPAPSVEGQEDTQPEAAPPKGRKKMGAEKERAKKKSKTQFEEEEEEGDDDDEMDDGDGSGIQPSPGPVMTALAAGGAACGAMGATWCGHALVAIPMSVLSLCPLIGFPWMIYLLVGMPLVVAEAGTLAGQAVAGKYGKRRVSNLMVWAGAAPVLCTGILCTNLIGLAFTAVYYAVFFVLAAANQQDLGNIVGFGILATGSLVSILFMVGAFGASAATVGALAAYTGRPLFEGEKDLNWDLTKVPLQPELDDDADEE